MTKTGSGRGCGDDWPLCNGKFVPAYTLESLIEYSHRFVTGIVGIIVVVTFWYTWRHLRHHREAAAYAGGTLLFTIVQALMGAAAVKWPQQPAVMALHFGISLLAVASSMLLVAWCYRVDKKTGPASPRHLPKWIYIAAWGIWIYCYGVVYLGAYIRHTGTEGACMGWPLCNGELIPYLYGASGIVFAHRAAAAVLLLLLAGLHILVRRAAIKSRRSDWRAGTVAALALTMAQIVSGGLLTLTIADENAYLLASLLHNVLATLLFGVLTDIAIRSWKHRMQ